MVDKGDDEKFRGLENGHKSFSKYVFWVDLCVGVLCKTCEAIIGGTDMY
jgi:hypothetical protein